VSQHPDYQPFIPPGELAEKTPLEWSRSEAQTYAKWLHSCRHDRVNALITYFGMKATASPLALVGPLGDRTATALFHEPFSKAGEMTNLGRALAADMGLLLATALQCEHPELAWDIVRKPKSDVSYNQPVLVGFGTVAFDPIQVSMTQAFGVLRGTKDGTVWQRLFDYWSEKAVEMARGLAEN
jgi:hypothetical protein